MREVITKAIKKAQSRGYDPNQTADLVMDYLDIAGLITGVEYADGDGATYPVAAGKNGIIAKVEESPSTAIEAPPAINRTITKAQDPNETFWTADSLFEVASKLDWSLEALPQGFTEPLKYNGSAVLRPRGIDGVAVVFRCPDVKTPPEIPIFLSLSEKVLDPDFIKSEVRKNVESMFRPRTEPIKSNFVANTSAPSLDDIAKGGGMYAGNIV